METLQAMGENCILSDREVNGSLAGASTDMGQYLISSSLMVINARLIFENQET